MKRPGRIGDGPFREAGDQTASDIHYRKPAISGNRPDRHRSGRREGRTVAVSAPNGSVRSKLSGRCPTDRNDLNESDMMYRSCSAPRTKGAPDARRRPVSRTCPGFPFSVQTLEGALRGSRMIHRFATGASSALARSNGMAGAVGCSASDCAPPRGRSARSLRTFVGSVLLDGEIEATAQVDSRSRFAKNAMNSIVFASPIHSLAFASI